MYLWPVYYLVQDGFERGLTKHKSHFILRNGLPIRGSDLPELVFQFLKYNGDSDDDGNNNDNDEKIMINNKAKRILEC